MSFANRLIVKPGSKVDLADHDPDDTSGMQRQEAEEKLRANRERLFELQELLYAENRHALLVVLQAMDTGGKDGVIRHVIAGMNPIGVHITSFKQPTPEELDHDFLWRIHKAVPAKGEVGVFNRSHYEDVLVVRVHELVPRKVWGDRYEQINQFEELLACNGITIVKFFLHVSKDEQLKRLKARLEDPSKHWKFAPGDLKERKLWAKYQRAYEDAISKCSTEHAPWFIIPANRKWFRNLAVSQVLVETLEGLKMRHPKPEFDVAKVVLDGE